MTKRIIALLALATLAMAGIGGHDAVYLGGTATVPVNQKGALDTGNAEALVYRQHNGELLRIPYQNVTSIEYGQKAGRRVGAAIATAVLVSPVGLALLLSHKRKHILTIGWTVDAKSQAAIFEVGKDAIRPTLAVLEARTGKKTEYESEDAKKNIGR